MVRPAWETDPGPRLFIGIPTKGPVDMQWALAFASLIRNIPPHVLSLNSAPAVDWARNALVETFLGTTCEWFLWLDSDVMPPPDAFAKLSAKQMPIVSAVYRARNVSFATQSMWPVVGGYFDRQVIDGHETLVVKEVAGGWKPGEVIPVDAVGMGCVLMHRRVIEALDPPWFNYTMRYKWTKGKEWEREDWVSEDWYFFKKVKDAGFKVYLDTTVECIHLTTVNIMGDGRIQQAGFK